MTEYFYTYILLCADGSYYVGVTNDIERRIVEHNSESYPLSYCHSRRPVELVYYEMFTQPSEAIKFEKQIKRWTRVKKKALIEKKYERLKELASCKNETTHLNYNKEPKDESNNQGESHGERSRTNEP